MRGISNDSETQQCTASHDKCDAGLQPDAAGHDNARIGTVTGRVHFRGRGEEMATNKEGTWGEISVGCLGCLITLGLYAFATVAPIAIATCVVVAVLKLMGVF